MFCCFDDHFYLEIRFYNKGMNKYCVIQFVLLFTTSLANAQIPKKRLPQNVNVPTYSHVFPSLSGDGNQMIYLTNYTNSEGFETKYTYRTGQESWADPEPIPSINRPGLDHIGSFCLSYDGNYVVFSSRRTPTIGNYDIWISEKKGKYWSQPKNPGKPLNSPAFEGNPSMSPDGKSIYFMRCESMDNTKKRSCSLFVSHRISATRWSEPQALPDYINTGHETTPKIMADNKTLIFASGRSGGKGKLDLYSTKLEYGTWSRPRSMSFLNTAENDEFISVPARGDIIYFTGTYRDQFNIYKAIIPQEFRPEKVLMLSGTVTYNDQQNPSDDILVQAFDVRTGEVFTTTKLKQDDNSFTIFLPEGTIYDVSAFPQKGGYTFASKIYDLENMLISRKEDYPVNLSSLNQGTILPLTTIRFENYSSVLSDKSNVEIKRIMGFLKKNPGTRIEIGAFIDTVYTDSIPSNELTEVIADTIYWEINKTELSEETALTDTIISDAVSIDSNNLIFDIDSNEFVLEDASAELSGKGNHAVDTSDFSGFDLDLEMSLRDSIIALGYKFFEETDELEIYYKVNYTYHNDRTQKQADALMKRLIASGVPANLLVAKGYGADWIEDHASEERNYWIELKILSH